MSESAAPPTNPELEAALDLIAEVPDFPEPGVRYRDITPMLADPEAFHAVTEGIAATLPGEVDLVAGVEARGFVFAAAVAYSRGLGVLPLRKPGKLPKVAERVSYRLEYGTAGLELPADTVPAGNRVAVIDDVLATGGTVLAACQLLEAVGATVPVVAVALELADLAGRDALSAWNVQALRTA